MKIFLAQPRLQYFLLSSLTLPFFGGVTSQTVVLDEYAGPNPVVENTRINFTGNATSTTGSYPTGISFQIKNTNGQTDNICNMNFRVCDSTLDRECYCSSITVNTYYFVIQFNATLERNDAFIIDDLDTTRVAFPLVIAQTTTVPPTTGAGDHTDHTGEIVGGVFGGLAGIALGICIYCICKKKKVCCWKGAPVKTGDPSPTTVELGTTCNNGRATSQ